MQKTAAKLAQIDDTVILAIIVRCENPKNVEEISIRRYNAMVAAKPPNKADIAEMAYHRFYGRYIRPYCFDNEQYKSFYKHGFAMMASSCLLIEALESFKRGWDETPRGENQQAFKLFFQSESAFAQFDANQFYKNIRCGILHQGETTGGYTIAREGALFDKKLKRINATRFIAALENSLVGYKNRLLTSEWDSEIWDNFRRKMRFIISNCKTA